MAAERIRYPLLPFLLVPLALGACASNPVTGKQELALVSEAQELRMGTDVHEAILAQFGRYDDLELEAYVARIGARVASVSHRPGIPYRFFVLDTDEVNAMAIPGHVYVTRGLLAVLGSEAELAAVLGHEVAHITARHSVQRLGREALTSLALDILSPQGGAQLAGKLLKTAYVTGYGREQELEADRVGARYAAMAGYEPEAMLTALRHLKNYSEMQAHTQGVRGYHGLFSTHPDHDKRLQEAVRSARGAGSGTRIGRDDYLMQIDGMRLGADTSGGLVEEGKFHYPALGFVLDLPDNWSAENTPEVLEVSSPDGTRSLRLTLAHGASWKQACTRAGRQIGVPMREHSWSQYPVCASRNPGGSPGVALLRYSDRYTLVFEVTGRTGTLLERTVRSVQPMSPAARNRMRNRRLALYTARPGDTYEGYAQAANWTDDHAIDWLRLVNGDWPDGEPVPGEVVKTVENMDGKR